MKPKTRAKASKSARSKKASTRVTAAGQEEAASVRAAKAATRAKAMGAGAAGTAAARQFGKTRAQAIQAHVQARGQRQQARRDSR